MSRSNPTPTADKNPSTRWFDWNGAEGRFEYYDKDAKQTVPVPLPFTFLWLDRLGDIGGWHNASQSGIYSNAVRDTRREPFVVRSFKGGTLAEGIYRDIRDKVRSAGGKFQAVCYIGYKTTDGLKLGAVKFAGAALNAWVEFEQAHGVGLHTDAVQVASYKEGRKGSIVFRVPVFALKPVSQETADQAVALDRTLQTFLASYLQHPVAQAPAPSAHDYPPPAPEVFEEPAPDIYDDDIPF